MMMTFLGSARVELGDFDLVMFLSAASMLVLENFKCLERWLFGRELLVLLDLGDYCSMRNFFGPEFLR